MSGYKVIFHIDEISKWKLLLGNVSNLLKGIDNEKLYIEVLANSEAVKYYDTNQDLDADISTMESLNKKSIKFVACNNALMAYDIKKDDIIHFVDIVPAGVVELVRKQSEGYVYIKP
jgi:intracellular sulfur oxidation DsrE/DsrF family protein